MSLLAVQPKYLLMNLSSHLPMKYRLLGKTGLKVSEIGFGCWGIGGGMWGSTDDDEAVKALQAAYDNGINFFDTALVYGDGHSERLVAKAVGEEKGVVIASKIPPNNMGWPASGNTKADDAFSRDYVTRTARISFANLGNRPIELMQLHVWHDNWLDDNGWYDGLVALRDEGIIKHFGVSVNSLQPETAVKLAESGKAESFQEEKLFHVKKA